ncbi:hypothetical protein HPB52_021492 [Rhipicephalus sanguineus]|uniref:EGF-like domain-containing protein n=1 Tax=Rhipicephalus sanguineus TaxID=34632 RepID=A0A9D4T861_RHISA|nr:hypothetical protein HPB52_021492 [Rhipicephalus sanguineus]
MQRFHVDTTAGAQEVPRLFFSDAPAARPASKPCRVAVPRLHRLGSGCGGPGGQLPLPAGVTFCATCGVAVHFRRHYHGYLHVAGKKAAVEKEAKTKRASGAPAPLGQRCDADLAALCRRRLGGKSPVCGTVDRAADAITANQRQASDRGRRGRPALCYPQCMNGGTCVAPGVCDCAVGYQGPHCEGGESLAFGQ